MDGIDETTLLARLGEVVATELDPDAEWAVERTAESEVAVALEDRTLRVERRDGPGGENRYALALEADDQTVSKHGPFASVSALAAELQPLLTDEVGYTVCCDG